MLSRLIRMKNENKIAACASDEPAKIVFIINNKTKKDGAKRDQASPLREKPKIKRPWANNFVKKVFSSPIRST